MTNLIKHDLYRVRKSKLFYCIVVLVIGISLLFSMIVRNANLGIFVAGYVMEFRDVYDVIRTGVLYQRGLGIFVSILISIFIGQEYQWRTWQHKWLSNKNRTQIYLSKLITSAWLSVLIFLAFQLVALIFSNQITEILTLSYIATIIGGIAIYATLGAVLCMISMLAKSATGSVVACLCYILIAETLLNSIINFTRFSEPLARVVAWGARHSILGMSLRVSIGYNFVFIIINAIIITFLSTIVGLAIFQKSEL